MNEIYWMTVVGNLSTAFMVVWIVALLVTEGDMIEDEGGKRNFFKWLKRFVVCGVIAAMASLFIPSTKEMFLIYGVGGTIDYIKTNDTAKQLPDKCIKALDRFADKYIDEPEKDK